MEVMPGYKQTELGVIPGDWDVRSLREISPKQSVGLVINPSSYFDDHGTVPLLVGSHIFENKIVSESANRISEASNVLLSASRIWAGDLVMVRVGDPGVTAVVPPELDGCNCASMMIVRQHPRFNSSWLCHMMNSPAGRAQVEHVQYGTAQKQFNISDAVNFSYATPTLGEQEAIAEALSDADALIESLEQLIAKKRLVKQGTMADLLTGNKRLPSFTDVWVSRPLSSFTEEFIVPMRDKPKRFGGEIPWCRIEDFDGTYLSRSKSGRCVASETVAAMNLKVYPVGTLLVSCSADLGRCAIAAVPLVSNQTFIGLHLDRSVACPLFFYYLMTSKADELNNLSSGTTISYLSREQFEQFVLLAPPTRGEQEEIAAVLSDMDAEIDALEAKLAKARRIKQGMMQDLLTGRIRLV